MKLYHFMSCALLFSCAMIVIPTRVAGATVATPQKVEVGDVVKGYVDDLIRWFNAIDAGVSEAGLPEADFPEAQLCVFDLAKLADYAREMRMDLGSAEWKAQCSENCVKAVGIALAELDALIVYKQRYVVRAREAAVGAGAFVAGKAKNAGGVVLHLPTDFGALSRKNKAGVVAVALTGTAGLAALIMNRQPVAAAVRTAGSGVASAVRTAGTGVAGFARRMFGAGKQQQSDEQVSSSQAVVATDAQGQA